MFLAKGDRKIATKNVIVKRISAIEDLGGIEILCSDKTGTLTENNLEIADIYAKDEQKTLWLANLASAFELDKRTDPFDVALERKLSPFQKDEIKKVVKLDQEAFDPILRFNAVLVKHRDHILLIKRGAPEAILESCSQMSESEKEKILEWLNKEGRQGKRVLAIAYKEIEDSQITSDVCDFELKKMDFIFCGLIAFVDPIKKTAFDVIKKAKKLGVRIMIITGDSPEVAGWVAYHIGLIDSQDKVITGEKWKKASLAERERMLSEYNVFARVLPEEKFSIIQSLRKEHRVGFLGEGINDAPALKIAGVSIVVDTAADIAREVSDIILLKKDLNVVVDGIKEGRQVFANTTKYIKATLASNFGNFFAVATASLVIDFLPLLPLQILLLNLLSDTPMIAISTDTVDDKELKSPRNYQIKNIITIAIVLGLVSTVFDFIFFSLFYRISPEVLQTKWFIGSILTELGLLFSIRTRSFFLKAKSPSQEIVWLTLGVGILTVGLPFTNFGQKVFAFTQPASSHLVWIFLVVTIYLIVSEIVKLMYYKINANK